MRNVRIGRVVVYRRCGGRHDENHENPSQDNGGSSTRGRPELGCAPGRRSSRFRGRRSRSPNAASEERSTMHHGTIKRFLGYRRVSTGEQGSAGTSLDGQKEELAGLFESVRAPTALDFVEVESAGAEKEERRVEVARLLERGPPRQSRRSHQVRPVHPRPGVRHPQGARDPEQGRTLHLDRGGRV